MSRAIEIVLRVAPGLAVVALLWLAYGWAEGRGRASVAARYEPVMKLALQRQQLAAGSIVRLREAIERQNRASLALATREREVQAAAQRALAAARERDKTRGTTIAALNASAAAPRAGVPCEPSPILKDAWR